MVLYMSAIVTNNTRGAPLTTTFYGRILLFLKSVFSLAVIIKSRFEFVRGKKKSHDYIRSLFIIFSGLIVFFVFFLYTIGYYCLVIYFVFITLCRLFFEPRFQLVDE